MVINGSNSVRTNWVWELGWLSKNIYRNSISLSTHVVISFCGQHGISMVTHPGNDISG